MVEITKILRYQFVLFPTSSLEALWPHDYCARLRIKRSGFEPWPRTLCCVKNVLLVTLSSWARHFTLTVPLSTQVNKLVPAYVMLGVTLRWTNIPPGGGIEILLVASCHRNRDKLRADELLGSYVDLNCLSDLTS